MAETAVTEPHVDDLTSLSAGRRIEVFSGGVLHYRGIVEETFPDLGVVWIREAGTGSRKMLDVTDYDLRPADPTREPLVQQPVTDNQAPRPARPSP